ncbi:tetratricopeptide repeat protein [Acidobacteriota bacterium]
MKDRDSSGNVTDPIRIRKRFSRLSTGRLIVLAVLLGVMALMLRFRLEQIDRLDTARHHSVYVPSGQYARIGSLGFRSLMADLLYVWSIQYYSNEERQGRFKHLVKFYDLITDLDPKFANAYVIGALILGWEAREFESSLSLLEKGMEHNPDNWYLPFEAGFYCFKDLEDPERALPYFEMAKDKPNSPELIGRWYGYMLKRSGNVDDALAFWENLYLESEDELTKRVALRHYKQVKIERDLSYINAWIGRFHLEHGRCPKSFDELYDSGYTSGVSIPLAPGDKPYKLNLRECKASHEADYLENR